MRISDYISKSLRAALCLAISAQILVTCVVLPSLAYNDAVKRADFLAGSNLNSIAMMMSTGDIFQAQILLNSFISDQIPFSTVIDTDGSDIKAREKSSYQEYTNQGEGIILTGKDAVVLTKKRLAYNGIDVGTLVLMTRIDFTYWIIVSLIMAVLSFLTFFLQNRYLKGTSLKIASAISELESFVKVQESENDINEWFSKRTPSNVHEIDALAKKIIEMMMMSARMAKIEKEAAIGRITANLSHDLRSRLLFFEQMLLMPENTTIESQYRRIREGLNRVYGMIESLRHTEAETLIHLSRSELDLQKMMIDVETLAKKARISIRITAAKCIARIDYEKFERSCMNLAANALDFARTEVAFEMESKGSDLVLRVIDDGPGVHDDILPRLFQRGATHGKHDGSGLGLAYVRQIMRGHGGDITYNRADGRTIFECYFPDAVDNTMGGEPYEALNSNNLTYLSEAMHSDVKQVSICCRSSDLDKMVYNRLIGIAQSTYSFVIGFSAKSSIVLTDSEETAEQALGRDVRPILMSSLSNEEIVRRAPIRLGIKG